MTTAPFYRKSSYLTGSVVGEDSRLFVTQTPDSVTRLSRQTGPRDTKTESEITSGFEARLDRGPRVGSRASHASCSSFLNDSDPKHAAARRYRLFFDKPLERGSNDIWAVDDPLGTSSHGLNFTSSLATTGT
jgi:hypothetical protein